MESIRNKIERSFDQSWYSKGSWTKTLTPLSWIYGFLAKRRRVRYILGKLPAWSAPVPVCVVGNITVGGTGKTPLVAWLALWFARHNIRAGIVSRGHGGRADYPLEVSAKTSFREAGDEAVMLARRTKCPVFVDRDRARAVQKLTELHSVDVVLADDGLQHYALDRDFEIAVLDGKRKIGNGMLLPSGPLRESISRLSTVNWIVANGCKTGLVNDEWVMHYLVTGLVNVADETRLSINEFQDRFGTHVKSVAGIGNSTRFEKTLMEENFTADFRAFRDHHVFAESDFHDWTNEVIVSTEKDAQKIRELKSIAPRTWYAEIDVKFEEEIDTFLLKTLQGCGMQMEIDS
ncbi:MAG: tetraacyldisaccharide 4'-kinase [Gammaproteobacteria bacterium]|nr:tetraacyldisaccharide 4'-kinase [Gammaproteobacteria bacterium]